MYPFEWRKGFIINSKQFSQSVCDNKSEIYNVSIEDNYIDENNSVNRDDLVISDEKLEIIKKRIKIIDWNKVSTNWTIKYRRSKNYDCKEIVLNPFINCSKGNPLYLSKKWLEWLYYDEDLNLNDEILARLCNFKSSTSIIYWRKKFNIPTKLRKNKYITKDGYIYCLMPENYKHPQIKPTISGKIRRLEHSIIMENYLHEHPDLDISKYALLDGRYLRSEWIVHHINHIRSDNRLENLWLYRNRSEHGYTLKTLNNCFRDLIKLGQISFNNGKYFLYKSVDYRTFEKSIIMNKLKSIEIINFDNIEDINEEIKKINWYNITDDWIIENQIRGNAPIEIIHLDPYSDCSDKNPLYKHKLWLETIVTDKRFNLTDSRLAKLCIIPVITVYRWRWEKHKIATYDNRWGKYRYITRSSSKGDHVWIKLPKNHGNPFAKKKVRYDVILEHRYIMEQYLLAHSELDISKKALLNGRYLKPSFIVHHINLDTLDNRLENLWVCRNKVEHNLVHKRLLKLVDSLLKSGFIIFDNGIYRLDY